MFIMLLCILSICHRIMWKNGRENPENLKEPGKKSIISKIKEKVKGWLNYLWWGEIVYDWIRKTWYFTPESLALDFNNEEILDKKQRKNLESKYEEFLAVSKEKIFVRLWKKRWLADVNGNLLIELKYDDVDVRKSKIWQGLVVKEGEKRGVVWIDWRNIIKFNCDDIYLSKKYSVAIVRIWDKYWLVSTVDGSIIHDVEYKKWKYINGKIILYKDEKENWRTVLDCKEYLVKK